MPTAHEDFELAGSHFRAGRLDEARTAVNRLLRKLPGDGPANHLLALILIAMGQRDRALGPARLAVSASPEDASARNTLGLLLLGRREYAAAETLMREATRLDPSSWHCRVGLSRVLLARHDSDAALREARAAAAFKPDSMEARQLVSTCLLNSARAGEAVRELRAAADVLPDDPELCGLHCLALHYPSDVEPAQIESAHRRFGELAARAGAVRGRSTFDNDRSPDRRLRVGFVSPDLRAHSVAYFFEPYLEHFDRAAIETYCYSTSPHADATTARLRAHSDHWREIGPRNPDGLAREVQNDRIDVLVDLCGHMQDHSLFAFARRLAPVQAAWIGYPDVTGVREMDYRLVDGVTDPPDDPETAGFERRFRLPRCFLAFRPDDAAPKVAECPADAEGHITFGSFNAASKLSDACLDLWAGAMRAVHGSRLIIKSDGMNDAGTRARVIAAMADRGIGAGRVECVGYIDAVDGHLGLYARVDIALDTFPYHGTTTTCEALWMGVPVVTLAGRTHVSRVGASLLGSLSLGSLVATDPAEFVSLAARLADDRDRRRELRAGLRERFLASALGDGPGLARAADGAWRSMWREWCAAGR